MSTSFDSRTFINGGMLRQYAGQNVSIMLRVESESGSNLVCMSTDKQKIRVSMPEAPGLRRCSWVEIIGTPVGADGIRGKEAILFGDEDVNLDEYGYNMMVQFLNNCKDKALVS